MKRPKYGQMCKHLSWKELVGGRDGGVELDRLSSSPHEEEIKLRLPRKDSSLERVGYDRGAKKKLRLDPKRHYRSTSKQWGTKKRKGARKVYRGPNEEKRLKDIVRENVMSLAGKGEGGK